MAEKSFYDYKKNRYTVVDYVGQSDIHRYLLKRDKDERFFVFDFSEDVRKTEKPLRSVFAKYDSQSMYNVLLYAEEIDVNDTLYWDNLKYDVLDHDTQVKAENEYKSKYKSAIANGWQEINIKEASFKLNGEVLQILTDNQIYDIKSQDGELKFSDMKNEEVISYACAWIGSYNRSVGDTVLAQITANNKVNADRDINTFVNSKGGKPTSEECTSKLVECLDMAFKYDGTISDRSFATANSLLWYMEQNQITFALDDALLGDAETLSYELADVLKQYHLNNEYNREQAIENKVEQEAEAYIKSKGVELKYASYNEKAYTSFKELMKSDTITLTAKGYTDNITGSKSYDIVAKPNYHLFDTEPCLIGCCNEGVLNKIIATQEGQESSAAASGFTKLQLAQEQTTQEQQTQNQIEIEQE